MSQYYLPFTLWNLFKCGKWFAKAFHGTRKEIMIAFREQRWPAAACSPFGEDASGRKKSVFFQTLPPCQVPECMFHRWFPMQNTVAECFQEALVAFRRHDLSTWLHWGYGTLVLSNRQIQLSSDFTSVIVSTPRTMRMKLASVTLPAACTVWLWTFWKFAVLKLKLSLLQDLEVIDC